MIFVRFITEIFDSNFFSNLILRCFDFTFLLFKTLQALSTIWFSEILY